MRRVSYKPLVFRILILIIVLLVNSNTVFSQIRVEEDIEISSKVLNKEVSLTVLLPSDYHIDRSDYPVVYLLHGYGGDHGSWINRCEINTLIDSLEQFGLLEECIYILPGAGNSYYINNYDSSINYSDFFIKELLPFVDSVYRTIPLKSARALLGLSMGGYGSIILAVKYPDSFGIVVALSAAVRDEEIFKALPQKSYEKLYAPVYGAGLAGEDRINDQWKKNSPYYLIDSLNAKQYRTIKWYIDCGLNDSLLPASEAFHNLLKSYNIPHEYHVRPGGHNWSYWYSSSVNGFVFIHNYFRVITN